MENETIPGDVLEKAAPFYGTTREKMVLLGGFENIVYEYESERVLRFTHSSHRKRELIQGEVDFVNYLACNKASVPRVIPSERGEVVEVIQFKDSYYSVVSFEKAKGIPAAKMKNEWDTTLSLKLGHVMGKIHALTKEYNSRFKRPQWYEDDFYYAEKYVPSETVIMEKSKALIDYLHTLPQDRDSYGLIHGDVNLSNLSVDEGEITLFDFDDSRCSWFAHDIAVALFFTIMDTGVPDRESFALSFMENFMTGYHEENNLDPFWLRHIPLFLNLHVILCYNLINYDCDLGALDAWCQRFMKKRKYDIENDVPFVNLDQWVDLQQNK